MSGGTGTTSKPAHQAYMRHVRACRVAGAGHRCLVCLDLLKDADAESWRLAQARAERAVGTGR